jgi:hypothetical protein
MAGPQIYIAHTQTQANRVSRCAYHKNNTPSRREARPIAVLDHEPKSSSSNRRLTCFTQLSCPRNTCMFRRRSVGCFSRRSEPDSRYRRAYLGLIPKERATRKNSRLAAARRVAMKMNRRLRYVGEASSLCFSQEQSEDASPTSAAHFDRNETCTYFGDRTLECDGVWPVNGWNRKDG